MRIKADKIRVGQFVENRGKVTDKRYNRFPRDENNCAQFVTLTYGPMHITYELGEMLIVGSEFH